MARSRMIRHLADIHIQHGAVDLAEEELEQHIVRFPTDQDVLYRLLTLLEQQECFEQAGILYTRMKHIFEATGKQPAKHVRAVYERIQQSIASVHHTFPARSVELFRGAEAAKQSHHHPLSLIQTQAMPEVTSAISHGDLTHRTSNIFSSLAIDEPFNAVIALLQVLTEREEIPEVSRIAHRQLLELGIAAFITRLAQVDRKRISVIEREETRTRIG